jgi:endonuclease YncB( thermonuclease family)
MLLIILMPISLAKLGEAGIKVTCVIEGDTFEIQDFGEVRLADIGCPVASRPEGVDSGIKPEWTKSSIHTRPFS